MTAAHSPIALEQMLCFDLYSANHAFGRLYKPLLDPLGLTYPQYLVMVSLWTEDGLSVGEIGRKLGLESNTLTPLLKRLEASGLLTRSRDGVDERRVIVRLTREGSKLAERAHDVPRCVADAAGLTVEDIAELQDTLRRICRNIAASQD
ncbi:MarR family winged helix-turn-helix transcriptional regulator [Litorisediminicola beolgyonensis]|uniref:MarR family winged helix-turn-helix transcriptional regulator n=1 Tax=Litorisediminicola beolgyonensis TaxID=1173614 RepID=A0ABW3ZLI0_9RHOB